MKLPAKAASPSPATAAAAVPLPWGVPNGGLPGPPPGISHALSPGPAAETSLPGPPKEQEASTDAALGLSSLPEGSLPPTAPLGKPLRPHDLKDLQAKSCFASRNLQKTLDDGVAVVVQPEVSSSDVCKSRRQ